MTKTDILRKIKRIESRVERIKRDHGDSPGTTHTYHGGWDLGYWQGRLSALEDVYDEIETEDDE